MTRSAGEKYVMLVTAMFGFSIYNALVTVPMIEAAPGGVVAAQGNRTSLNATYNLTGYSQVTGQNLSFVDAVGAWAGCQWQLLANFDFSGDISKCQRNDAGEIQYSSNVKVLTAIDTNAILLGLAIGIIAAAAISGFQLVGSGANPQSAAAIAFAASVIGIAVGLLFNIKPFLELIPVVGGYVWSAIAVYVAYLSYYVSLSMLSGGGAT